ncbi:MAG: M1 family metallopeptidase [Planctomycetes bacterium]|nr:M1 family metallopeptidase [Planctomycetota bacterium]
MKNSLPILLALLVAPSLALAQEELQTKNGDELFRQLDNEFATPTSTRAASGAPGHRYWQQQVDYVIDARLDESKHRISGKETITYTNNSPDTLRYLWVQLDQNIGKKNAEALRIRTTSPVTPGRAGEPAKAELSYYALGYEGMRAAFKGGHAIASVTDEKKAPLAYSIVGTMMRVDLKTPLAPGKRQVFSVVWAYNIRNISRYSTRTGYEFLKTDPLNAIYTIAHWYPRMAAYSDRYGWHVHHYVGEEFALEFGDFKVRLTLPDDYVLAATGELQNAAKVLTKTQRARYKTSQTAKAPVFVVTPAEAKAAEKGRSTKFKTWEFLAKNVRDYAWAASRKYIWDAQGVSVGDKRVMAMSYYPNQAEPLWSRYSTAAVAHTLKHYSRYFPYPYPVALSCNGAVGGMEHPMISFQRARPEEDGTYSPRQKYGLISVIIHEVGHNWFPMIVNNDERRWRWMDEGFNSFVQQVSEGFWEKDYPSRNDSRRKRVLDYMASSDDQPIMTATGLILQGGNNAYSKTALALTVLRESILGREAFDFAFREYCHRWAFKRPMPEDFFRTMEDASGRDLDWFFRGWFYSADHVDLAITGIRRLELETRDPDIDKPLAKARKESRAPRPRQARNAAQPKRIDAHPGLSDFYNTYDEFEVTLADRKEYKELLETLKPHERKLLKLQQKIYVVDFENRGGLPMPLLLTIHYADHTQSALRLPASIWRRSIGGKISKLLLSSKPIVRIVLDAEDELADTDLSNNAYPPQIQTGTLRLTTDDKKPNVMQQRKKAAEERAKAEAAKPKTPAKARADKPKKKGARKLPRKRFVPPPKRR